MANLSLYYRIARLSRNLDRIYALIDRIEPQMPSPWRVQSAQETIRKGQGMCLDSALVAVDVAEHHGYNPTLLHLKYDFTSKQRGKKLDSSETENKGHVVCMIQTLSGYVAVGFSTVDGLKHRKVPFGSVERLAESYVDASCRERGLRTLAWHELDICRSPYNWRNSSDPTEATTAFYEIFKDRSLIIRQCGYIVSHPGF